MARRPGKLVKHKSVGENARMKIISSLSLFSVCACTTPMERGVAAHIRHERNSIQAEQPCRGRPRATALRDVEADAIVLAMITGREGDGLSWRATAVSRGTLMGDVPQREFSFASEPGFGCDQSWPPRLDRYWVLYLRRTGDGLRVHRGYPYWWARASRDPRLALLDRLLPLGTGAISGTIDTGGNRVWVTVTSPDGLELTMRTWRDGRYRFRHLPAGTYTISHDYCDEMESVATVVVGDGKTRVPTMRGDGNCMIMIN
jgi:hypothetical protein